MKSETGSSIRVRRTAKAFPDRLRKYAVMVDGARTGSVGRDETVVVPVAPGQHHIRLKIDWCSSPEVIADVPMGSQIALTCEPTGGFQGFVAMVARPRSYLKLWRDEK
jgi:hypothetical protein